MIKRFFVLWTVIFLTKISIWARPYGVGLDRNQNIQFDERWNEQLEVKEKHPLKAFEKPFWNSKVTHHMHELGRKRYNIRPLRQVENSLEWNALYLFNTDLDINLAVPNLNPGGIGGTPGSGNSAVRFDTRGFAHEFIGRFPALGYNLFGSMFLFHPENVLTGEQRATGYNLSFGNTVSEYSGLCDTNFNFLKLGNERFLDKKAQSRFSMLWGLSHLNFQRFERLRGLDRLGLNQSTSNILANDPIIIEQGEYRLEKRGLGAFLGFRYHSHLGSGLSWSSALNYHGLSISQETETLIQKVSRQSLIEQNRNQIKENQMDGLIDFELKFQKYLRDFYNFSLGFRYLQYLEKPRRALDGIERDKFSLKGIQLSFQRFF